LAAEAEAHQLGLFNNLGLPLYVTIPAAFVLFDLAIYLQHVMFHAVPLLWRFHRMHHADLNFDVTTGVRFHPIEILLSLGIKLGLVAVIGPPAVAVLIFEAALNSTSMFNHSNLRIPDRIDAVLRNLLVTPDMHRVHHSIVMQETNSNFGFNLSWWDRILGTYCLRPAAGHEQMIIGIDIFRDPAELRLYRILLQPFKSGVGNYPINRRAA
jgi:sterol desaturase/sphingolipid hydroxylase (fatty acid hydroxylase superfamily)